MCSLAVELNSFMIIVAWYTKEYGGAGKAIAAVLAAQMCSAAIVVVSSIDCALCLNLDSIVCRVVLLL